MMMLPNARGGQSGPPDGKAPTLGACLSRSILQMQVGCLWEASLGQDILS